MIRPAYKGPRLASALVVALIILAGSAPARAQGNDYSRFTARSLTPARIVEQQGAKTSKLVSVIVKLDVAPLATYAGDIPGLAATSPAATGAARLDSRSAASQRYLAYVDQRLGDFERAVRAQIPQAHLTTRYRYVFGGVAVALPEQQVDVLAKLPGVIKVYRDQLRQPTTDHSPQFIGAPTIWNALGGQESAGEGVVVGVVDTGVWPEHPSFADPDPSGKPYAAPPASWHGSCEQPTDGSPALVCNNKLIGARKFLETYRIVQGGLDGDFDSPRDHDGHGTHTSSTAAGNPQVHAAIFGVDRGTISGIAPRAHVAMYKACGPMGCFFSDTAAAIDQAVADGVNVINYSIGGGTDPFNEAPELAFLDAYAAGVFVAASAGNSGPGPSTAEHVEGWVTTVAASTQKRAFVSTLTLQDAGATLTLTGSSITDGVPNLTPVVLAKDLGDELCQHSFEPLSAQVSGKIVACRRGVNARVEKGHNVSLGGAAGMILYNFTLADTETDNHWLPTVHLADGTSFLAFMAAHPAASAKFTPGKAGSAQGDVMAAFSSRGPSADNAFIKPDITAPGVQILAGHTPEPLDVIGGPPGQLFQAIAGTSMSSPHIAGSGALLKALHPDWTPGQIKSALMTSALSAQVVKEDTTTPADPYDMGSGRVNLKKAGNPGLTFDVTATQYAAGVSHAWDLNYPSIHIPAMPGRFTVVRTAHSELDRNTTWRVKTTAPPGVTISVTPAQLSVPAHGDASFVATIEAKGIPDGTYFGSIDLSSRGIKVHMPVAFVLKQPIVALTKQCSPGTISVGQNTTCTIAVANSSVSPATVSVRDDVPRGLRVEPGSVSGATVSGNTLTYNARLDGGTGEIHVVADPGGSPAGYLPLASLGVPPLTGVCDNCDEALVQFEVPAFKYFGQTYTRLSMTTDGYLIVGDDVTVDFRNQHLPDALPPNNVIAPYWTDLDLDGDSPTDSGGGTWSFAGLTDTTTGASYLVAEWTDAAEFAVDGTAHSFQVWIKVGTDEIFMTYGPNTATALQLTVGAENVDGSVGDNYYFSDGSALPIGTPPAEGDELAVHSPFTPATHTITFRAAGVRRGTYVNTAELTSSLFQGTNLASARITVNRP
jgi:uncharacterized repeat protein (TIGR01451 family)